MKLEKKADEFNHVNQIIVTRLSQMQIILPFKDIEKDELKEGIEFVKEQLKIMDLLLE
jgi:hypothetical protein